MALRPFSWSPPECAARPFVRTQNWPTPLRQVLRAPSTNPPSSTNTSAASFARRSMCPLEVRLPISSSDVHNKLTGRVIPDCSASSMAARAMTMPPFISSVPGPRIVPSSSPYGNLPIVPSGKTVSMWQSSRIGAEGGRLRSEGEKRARTWAPVSWFGMISTCAPSARASSAPIAPTQSTASFRCEGDSVSTRCLRRDFLSMFRLYNRLKIRQVKPTTAQ